MSPRRYKGKKRMLRVAQINLMILEEGGTIPVVSWLLQKIEEWEYDSKKKQLTLRVVGADDSPSSLHVLKLPEAEGKAALAAIEESVSGLVAERRRLKKEAEERAAASGAGNEPPSPSHSLASVPKASLSSDDFAHALNADKMMPCKVKGKKRQLKVAQMNISLFDEAGTKPVSSWLYEKLEGWEYIEKKNVLTLKVIGADEIEIHDFKMTWPEDAKLALDGIKANVDKLVEEKKRLFKEDKAKKKQKEASEIDLQERINKALSDSFKDTEQISQLLGDAKTAKHIHPSVIALQKKLSELRRSMDSDSASDKDGGSDGDSSVVYDRPDLSDDEELHSEEEEAAEKEEDEGDPDDKGSTTEDEDEDEDEEDQGELSLQDKIDDALEPAFTDLKAMKALLNEARTAKHVHPSVISLGNKIESLEAEQEEDEFDEGGDTLGELPAKPKKKVASTARRMSVAEQGVKGVIEEAAIASLGMEGVVPEQMFNVSLKKKKGHELQFKVGQMNCQLFDGPQMLGSWLYLSIHEWQYLPSSQIFDMTVPKLGAGDKTEKIELFSIDEKGEEIAELMTTHAKNIARQMKQDKIRAGMTDDVPIKSTFDGSATTFECKLNGKKRQLKIGRRNIMIMPESGTGSPLEVWDFEVKVKGWEWAAKKKLLKLNVLEKVGEPKELLFSIKMTDVDGPAALEVIDASIQALLLEKKEAKSRKKGRNETNRSSGSPSPRSVDSSDDDSGTGTGLGWESKSNAPVAESPAAVVDVSPPETYEALSAGMIRAGVGVESQQLGTMVVGEIYTVTKKSQHNGSERVFIGHGWVSPVARTGRQLLVKLDENSHEQDSQSTRDKCGAAVLSYISLSGPEFQVPAVGARVIKALASSAPPEEWVSCLEEMAESESLNEFLEACKADTGVRADKTVEQPTASLDLSHMQAALQSEAKDTDEETESSSPTQAALQPEAKDTDEETDNSSRDDDAQHSIESARSAQPRHVDDDEESDEDVDDDKSNSADDWLVSDADRPAEFESPRSAAAGTDPFQPIPPQSEPEPEPTKPVDPVDFKSGFSFSAVRDSDGSPVALEVLAHKLRLSASGSDHVEDLRYQDVRSWWDIGNKVHFVLKANTSSRLGEPTAEGLSIVLRCEQDSGIANEIAQSVASAIATAASTLSPKSAAMLPQMPKAGRAAAEASAASAAKERAPTATEMQQPQRETERHKHEKEAQAAALAEAERTQEAEIAKRKVEMTASLQQQQQEAQAAAAAGSAASEAARQEALAEARRSAEAAEIAELKAEIQAEREAQLARSAALEQERRDAVERTRQLELIAMSNGRAAGMDAKLQFEKDKATSGKEVKAETLATQQEAAPQQVASALSEAARRADAMPNPSFEPVTGANPSPRNAPATESSLSAQAAALAEVPTPTPARTGEMNDVALTDRQLALGQAALSTLTERLEEMHRRDPSMLSSARFDALCNTIGDYSQNPSSAALEDVVKTTVRLAAAFKSDEVFAKQLQRKVFANPTVTAGTALAASSGSTVAAAEVTGNLVQSLQNEVATLRQEIMRLGSILQDPVSPRLSPMHSLSLEEGRRLSFDPTTVAQSLMDSAQELQHPTEASAEASVRSLYETMSAAEHKQRNADRSFAGRLLTLQAQLEQGFITNAQYSDEKRRLAQLAASPERSPTSASSLRASPASAAPVGDVPVPRHANGAPRIKKDVARSLALACLLRQVSIGELLPVVRSHLGVASISELEELEPADLNAVSLSPLHRRRLLRAMNYVKNEHVKEALLKGEQLARDGDIQAAIQQCRHALTLGPAGGLAPSPTLRYDEPAEAVQMGEIRERAAGAVVDRGVDGESHDYTDLDSDFFCDVTGKTLRLGAWWHRVGSSYDLCAEEYRKLPHGSARSGFLLVSKLSDLGNDRRRYGHGNSAVEEGVPPTTPSTSPLDPVRPPANRQLRQDIEKMAAYVMRHGGVGGDFDQIARRKQKTNPRFAFMFGGEGAEYYDYVTAELTRRMAQSATMGLATAQRKATASAYTARSPSPLTTT